MRRRRMLSMLALLAWLLIWQLAAGWLNMPVLLPGPMDTLNTLYQLSLGSDFWLSLSLSLYRIGLGYLLAIALGALIGLLCAFFEPAAIFLSPLRTLIRSTPVSSIIILVLLWLRVDLVPLFIAMLTVLPIIWQGVEQGIAETDKDLLEMSRAYAFSPLKRMRYLYLPTLAPYFYASCASALGFAWKAGIAAEVIAKPLHAIGRRLQDAKVYLNTRELFAWTLAVVLLSLLFEKVLKLLMLRRERRKARA